MFRLLTLGSRNFTAMAVWPFIISRMDEEELGPDVVHHERIHFRQQLEMLILPFYVFYFTEYLILWIKFGNRYRAYRSISFEREAYENEDDEEYLKDRKWFAWTRYL